MEYGEWYEDSSKRDRLGTTLPAMIVREKIRLGLLWIGDFWCEGQIGMAVSPSICTDIGMSGLLNNCYVNKITLQTCELYEQALMWGSTTT